MSAAPGGPTYPLTRYVPGDGSTRILLVRHGESLPFRPPASGPPSGFDPGLTPRGRDEAERLAAQLATAEVGSIWSSPALRARQTAAPLARRLRLRCLRLEELREVGLGQWEGGVVHQRIHQHDPIWAEVWRRERWDAIPGAEANRALRRRVRLALEAIRAGARGDTAVAFTHDGVIAAALSMASGATAFAFASCDTASRSELVMEPGGRWRVRSFNVSPVGEERELGSAG